MKKNKLSLAALPLLFLVSCQDQYDICDQNKSVNFKSTFYRKTVSGEAEATVSSLTITPVNTTATIYNQQPNISSFVFSLNPAVASAKYVIQVDNSGIKDTLSINYTSRQITLSPECGDIITHNVTAASLTKNKLDSVSVFSSKVDNNPGNNLKIYLK